MKILKFLEIEPNKTDMATDIRLASKKSPGVKIIDFILENVKSSYTKIMAAEII